MIGTRYRDRDSKISQLRTCQQFQNAVEDFAHLTSLRFDEEAAETFHRLQSRRLKVGTMDLKIAAICLSHDALLLTRPFDCAQGTRNLVDFEKVPGLRAENWLD